MVQRDDAIRCAFGAALSWIYCKKSLILFDLTGFRSLRSAFASI